MTLYMMMMMITNTTKSQQTETLFNYQYIKQVEYFF